MRVDPPQRLRPALAVLFGLAGLLTCLDSTSGQGRDRESGEASVVIRDPAHMFRPEAVAEAQRSLEAVAREASVPVLIETVEALRGQPIEDVSLQRAMQSGREGVYALLAKEERKLEVRASRRFRDAIDATALKEVRDAFVAGLRGDDADDGLRKGAAAIAKVLARVKAEAKSSPEAPARNL